MRILSPTIVALPLIVVAVLVTGCAAVDPRSDYDRAAAHVDEATGLAWGYRPQEDERSREQVAQLLRDGLTAADAAQICLLNNRKLQASLFEVGAARADVVQAGLLSNPTLSLGLKFPDAGGLAKLEAALVENLADLWQIPVRRRAAERALDRTILEVARDASAAVWQAKTAYFRAKQADRQREIAAESVQIARKVVDLTLARQQAGAGSEVDVNLARAEVHAADLRLRAATLGAFEARSALATHLALDSAPDMLELAEDLPDPPTWRASADTLLSLARASRLELQAATAAAAAAQARIREEQIKLFPTLEWGVSFERAERRPEEGRNILADSIRASVAERAPRVAVEPKEKQGTDTLLGPSLGLELPIFNQNQGGIARARYTYAQSLKLIEDLSVQVGQEVRLASARAETAWSTVSFYRDQVLPLRATSLDLAQTAYQAGRTPLVNVLEAERALLVARAGYAEALQMSAGALVELEQATGQPIAKVVEIIRVSKSDVDHGDPSSAVMPVLVSEAVVE